MGKNPPASTGDKGSIPGPGRFHMLCATTTEAHLPKACAPQQEKPQHWEAQAPQEPLLTGTRGSPNAAAKTQHSQKQSNFFLIFKKTKGSSSTPSLQMRTLTPRKAKRQAQCHRAESETKTGTCHESCSLVLCVLSQWTDSYWGLNWRWRYFKTWMLPKAYFEELNSILEILEWEAIKLHDQPYDFSPMLPFELIQQIFIKHFQGILNVS